MDTGAQMAVFFGAYLILLGIATMSLVLSKVVAFRLKLGRVSKHGRTMMMRIGAGYCTIGLAIGIVGIINIA